MSGPYPTHTRSRLALLAESIQRSERFHRKEDAAKAKMVDYALRKYVREQGPSGSGVDNGTLLVLSGTSNKKITFQCSFHHMDDSGYTRWTDHTIVVTPSFIGFDLRITGRDHGQIKEYLHGVYHHWLSEQTVTPSLIEYYI